MNENLTKRPRGRPAAVLDLGELQRLAGLGMSCDHIADRLQISRRTLFTCMADDPAVRAAFDAGGAEAEERAAARLEKAAVAGNIGADIFFLKTRRGWRERDTSEAAKVVIQLENQPATIHIEDADEMMDEQRRLIEASAERGD